MKDHISPIDRIFKDMWSISPENFKSRCEAAYMNPERVLKDWLRWGNVRVIANGHIEYIKS